MNNRRILLFTACLFWVIGIFGGYVMGRIRAPKMDVRDLKVAMNVARVEAITLAYHKEHGSYPPAFPWGIEQAMPMELVNPFTGTNVFISPITWVAPRPGDMAYVGTPSSDGFVVVGGLSDGKVIVAGK